MGRPLKIAKAQAVLTITDTAATGSIVTISGGNLTTSPTVGVAKGMPFQVATTVGGLTAGVTYFINAILSNTTFNVSATDLSVQPQVMATLTDTTTQTVSMSVGVVDAYFNNPLGGAGFPATNANTYGVVGGNTAIVGKQVLTRVAIGINGTGTLYSDSTANNDPSLFGAGTDLANTLSTGSAIQIASANINGGTDYTTVGFATATIGQVSVAVANTNATGNIIRTTGNASTLSPGNPVTFSANLGGLVTGTTYFVGAVANATAFTVTTTQFGAQQALSDASGTPNAVQDRVVLAANCPVVFSGASFVYANDEAGFIVRQKGKTKYLVTGGTTGLTAQCFTANVANTALTPNTMNILSTDVASATAFVSSINDYNSEVFPTQVAAGSISAGTVYTIYFAGTTNWTAIGAMANMTGITFTATASGSGTGTAVAYSVNPDVIATFNTAFAANAANGQPNPIVTISNA
jgi:hypothetical protein